MKNTVVAIVGLTVLAATATGALAAKKAATKAKKGEKKAQVVNSPLTDPNKVILVPKKQRTFKVNLKSNPTTGYSWILVDDYNSKIIKPVSHSFHPGDTKLVGAPGYETFTFKVDSEGFKVPQKLHLSFQYLRPWVVTESAQKLTFTVITSEVELQQPKKGS